MICIYHDAPLHSVILVQYDTQYNNGSGECRQQKGEGERERERMRETNKEKRKDEYRVEGELTKKETKKLLKFWSWNLPTGKRVNHGCLTTKIS